MSTVRAQQSNRLKISFTLAKSVIANFAQELAAASGIIVDVCMWCATVRTGAIRRNGVLPAGVDRFETLTMLDLLFFQQKYVVQGLNLLDDG